MLGARVGLTELLIVCDGILSITQQFRFVVYEGNAHYAAPYPVTQEKTTVKIGSGKTQSVTQVTPTTQENERVVYGPYKDQPAFNKVSFHWQCSNLLLEPIFWEGLGIGRYKRRVGRAFVFCVSP